MKLAPTRRPQEGKPDLHPRRGRRADRLPDPHWGALLEGTAGGA